MESGLPGVLPSVSVILIVRNGERFIADALESVFRSTLQPLEVLVVDGDSTDRTREIAAGFPSVTLMRQRGRGLTEAYNEGIAASRGELVAFISCDDRWLPGKLDRQVAFMAARPELLYTVSHVQHVLEPGFSPPSGLRPELLLAPVPGLLMEALVARRAAFQLIGLLDPSFETSSDTEWFARARDSGAPMAILPDTLVHKRLHDANTSLSDPRLNQFLLRAMHGSLQRKRAATPPG